MRTLAMDGRRNPDPEEGLPPPRLSLVSIVRDEEANLPRLLRSVEGLVDDRVIVDTGSTDRTVEIARSFGARVIHHPWVDCFSTVRNVGLSEAHGDYLLCADADEEVVGTDKEETRARLAVDEGLPNILLVRLTVEYPNGQEAELLAPRILRRSANLRFRYPIHETIDAEDELALLSNVTLHHHGYAAPGALARKETRNLRIARAMGADSPHGQHCVARAAFSLHQWDHVVGAADRLMALEAPPLLVSEACVLGAAAAFNLKDGQLMDRFVAYALALSPGSSDAQLVALVAAAAKYVHSVETPDPVRGLTGLRPQVFWHNKHAALQLLRSLVYGTSPAAGARAWATARHENGGRYGHV